MTFTHPLPFSHPHPPRLRLLHVRPPAHRTYTIYLPYPLPRATVTISPSPTIFKSISLSPLDFPRDNAPASMDILSNGSSNPPTLTKSCRSFNETSRSLGISSRWTFSNSHFSSREIIISQSSVDSESRKVPSQRTQFNSDEPPPSLREAG